jgi:hypothetical protein
VLPAAIERIRHKSAGTEESNRQMIDICNAALTDGRSAVKFSPPIVSSSANASAFTGTVYSTAWHVLMPSKKIYKFPFDGRRQSIDSKGKRGCIIDLEAERAPGVV